MQVRRYIKIDAENKTVVELLLEGNHLTNMQNIVGGYVERAMNLTRRSVLLVDEDGLSKGPPYGFSILPTAKKPGGHYVGNGCIAAMGSASEGTEMSIDDVKRMVAWRTCLIN